MENVEWWQSPLLPVAFLGTIALVLGYAVCGRSNAAPPAEAAPARAAAKDAGPCGDVDGTVPQYVKREAERNDYAGIPRLTLRIVVPTGLPREELRANICLAAVDALHSAEVKLGGVTVFAYSSPDTKGAYTAGRAVYAPSGDWAKANPDAPTFEWRVATDLAEGYFAAAPVLFAVGDQVELLADDGLPIGISRSATSWGDADFVARAPKGTKARVVTVKTTNTVDGFTMTRYEVTTSSGARGWVHAFAVGALSRKP